MQIRVSRAKVCTKKSINYEINKTAVTAASLLFSWVIFNHSPKISRGSDYCTRQHCLVLFVLDLVDRRAYFSFVTYVHFLFENASRTTLQHSVLKPKKATDLWPHKTFLSSKLKWSRKFTTAIAVWQKKITLSVSWPAICPNPQTESSKTKCETNLLTKI